MLAALKNETNITYTENGAKAFQTTKSYLLDFFAQGGALRNRNDSEIISMFSKALNENKLLAMKMLFYFRDIRGGQGERETFRILLRYLALHYSELIERNLHIIPYYGRFDDLYFFVDTKLEAKMFKFIEQQLEEDKKSDKPSLLGKWLKSLNTSSKESVQLAVKTKNALGLSSREYRKILSSLREKLNVVECLMSANQWGKINYEHVPSKASMNYRTAFYKHDEDRYSKYIESLKKGEAKINTGALFPYEIVHRVLNNSWNTVDETLDLMWANLPDYIGDKKENSIAVVDVSGSMDGQPIEVAISLGMYLAERNKGIYHNHFITFSNRPQLVEIVGKNLSERIRNISQAKWDMNTNIEAVFDLILNTAIKNKISKGEMIGKVYIVSDMEFDQCSRNTDEYLFKEINSRYEQSGYTMPKLVFWNVNARNQQFPMTMNEYGVQLVSGCSPSIFTNLMKGEFMSAYDLMLDVLNSERYDLVTV